MKFSFNIVPGTLEHRSRWLKKRFFEGEVATEREVRCCQVPASDSFAGKLIGTQVGYPRRCAESRLYARAHQTTLRRLCTTGYDLRAKVNRSRDRVVYDTAVRHFGSWREALTAAGINLGNVTHRRPKHLNRETMRAFRNLFVVVAFFGGLAVLSDSARATDCYKPKYSYKTVATDLK